MAVGSILFLYTDGLIERRGERLLDRQSELARAAVDGPSEPDALCGHVAETMLTGPAPEDDVALLALLYAGRAVATDLDLTIGTQPEDLAGVRRAIRAWLEPSGATETEIEATVLAANEACANAVEHAYGPGDATFDLRGEWSPDTIRVTISDWGSWRAPRGEQRGRGITLMRAFMDDVEIIPSETGTTVHLTKKLGALGP
jgi:anti-sigma regulatory factor (Ser/Thr protein kinase)